MEERGIFMEAILVGMGLVAAGLLVYLIYILFRGDKI